MTANGVPVKLLQCFLSFIFLQLVFITAQVPSITRNITDSFQGDNINCNTEPIICSKRNAICRPDGICVCNVTAPDYVNPMFTVVDGYLSYDTKDGCMSLSSVIDSRDTDNSPCSYSFFPYQVMPNRWTSEPTTFLHPAGALYNNCTFMKALAKYPGETAWEPLVWLNESYIEMNHTFPGYLDIRWTRSVPELHGLMITINLNCTYRLNAVKLSYRSFSEQCLRAKVLGSLPSTASTLSNPINLFSLVVLGFSTLTSLNKMPML